MSRIAKIGLSVTLLVCMLAAPAAAAPMERSEGGGEAVAAGWFGEIVDWLGGWLKLAFDEGAPRLEDDQGGIRNVSAGSGNEGGGGMDPYG